MADGSADRMPHARGFAELELYKYINTVKDDALPCLFMVANGARRKGSAKRAWNYARIAGITYGSVCAGVEAAG